jgi:hypothetical protein
MWLFDVLAGKPLATRMHRPVRSTSLGRRCTENRLKYGCCEANAGPSTAPLAMRLREAPLRMTPYYEDGGKPKIWMDESMLRQAIDQILVTSLNHNSV